MLRHGSDLSSVTTVWCATRPSDPPSASPGVDYIPSSKKVEFKPGKTQEVRADVQLHKVPLCLPCLKMYFSTLVFVKIAAVILRGDIMLTYLSYCN